jgi:hypothetical protein
LVRVGTKHPNLGKIGKNNYNDWERFIGITTTNGIPMVVVGYNGWDGARQQ